SLSQYLDPLFDKLSGKLKIDRECFSWRLFCMLRTLLLVSIGRCFARSGGFLSGVFMLKAALTHWDPWTLYDGTLLNLGLSQLDFTIIFIGILVLLVVGIMQEKGIQIRSALNRQNLWFRWAIMIGAIIAIVLFGVYGSGYNAISFIYAQF
ncbi:MAG: MBOAT family protein, partial [Bacillota bacterium]